MRANRTLARALATASLLLAGTHGAANAQVYTSGERFLANGGSVTVKYLGSTAAYMNTLQWFRSYDDVQYTDNVVSYGATGADNYMNLFTNKDNPTITGTDGATIKTAGTRTADGSTLTFGNFADGEEVLFGLFVQNEFNSALENPESPSATDPRWDTQDADDYTYFVGPQARNADGRYKLKIATFDMGAGTYRIEGGWEDIYGGGDSDYNDFIYEVSGVSVTPEPMSMALLGTGLAGLAGVARRRRRRDESLTA